jgi:hypothetical protein
LPLLFTAASLSLALGFGQSALAQPAALPGAAAAAPFKAPTAADYPDFSSNQLLTGQSGPPPRTPDGRPDLTGFWQGMGINRGFFASVGGKPPFTPAGAAAYNYNMTSSYNPEGLCLFAGIPRASISGIAFEIMETPQRVAFLYQLMNTFRTIPADGRKHSADPDPSYFGEGIGRWEGDTFVIDSIGFKDTQSWLDDDAHPHSDAMHTVERWTRIDADHLAHEVTVTDPKFYTRSWTFKRIFVALPKGEELSEYACMENNRDLAHMRFGPNFD